MRPVTFLVPDLGYASHAKQVALLAPALHRVGARVHVFSLGGPGPFADVLRQASIPIEGRNGRRIWDVDDYLALRQRIVATGAGLLHIFGMSALRAARLAGFGANLPTIVLSLNGREKIGYLERRLLRRVQTVLAPHAHAADQLISRGVPVAQVSVLAPAVAAAPPALERAEFCRALGVPTTTPFIVTGGQMRNTELFDAIWAFEFLRYPELSARLLMFGDGPARPLLERRARSMAPEGTRVVFLGARTDVPALLGLADVVMLPQKKGGANVALEALAAGRAVVARNTPDMAAVIADGQTGVMAVSMAASKLSRSTYHLLHDPERRGTIGLAAKLAMREREASLQAMLAEYQRMN